MKKINNLLTILCLCAISLSVTANDRFTVRSVGDERIVAIGTYNAGNPASILSGVPIRVGVGLINTITGEQLHEEIYSISLPSGAPSSVIGNNNIGRIASSYDIDTGELSIRFSQNVEDLSSSLGSSFGGDPAPFPSELLSSREEDQFKVTFVVDFSDTVSNNFASINSGSVNMTSMVGDGISAIILVND